MRRARGFSLVEVMLALVLLATGLALAFATLGDAGRATARAEAATARAERLRAVQGFLRRQLEGALLHAIDVESGTGEAIVFEGDADEVAFIAPMPGYLSRGGPYLQRFRLERGAEGRRLVFEHALMTPDGPLDPERAPEVLLEGIADGGFAFRTLADDGQPGDWTDDWDLPGQVPRLVRLRLAFAEGAHWPEFVAAPRVGQTLAAPVMIGGPTPDDPEDGR